jgi:hypothetical protein
MSYKSIFSALVLCIVFLLTACGGGGSNKVDPGVDEQIGQFIDSAVEGMQYVTSSGISGVTDIDGSFRYVLGDTVTFYIGDIEIGQAAGGTILTPVSLVSGATDETDTTVVNIGRFLQSLDEDNDPTNGITITAAVASAASGQSLDFSSVSFDTDGAALVEMLRTTAYADAGTLINSDYAEAHLQGSLICERAGSYSGTWVQTDGSDIDAGTWAYTADDAGGLSGTAVSSVYPQGGTYVLSGTVSSSGNSVVGFAGGGVTFNGTVGLDGTVSGTWSNSSFGSSGTYEGTRISSSSSSCISNMAIPVNVGAWSTGCVVSPFSISNYEINTATINSDGSYIGSIRRYSDASCTTLIQNLSSTFSGDFSLGGDIILQDSTTAKKATFTVTNLNGIQTAETISYSIIQGDINNQDTFGMSQWYGTAAERDAGNVIVWNFYRQ